MSAAYNESLLKPEARVLSTLESDGSRRWLFPRLAPGRYLTRRRIVAYLLIVIFTAVPYLHINGKPAMLLDLAHRRFIFFGITFLPTDTVLLALLMVSIFLTIFFVTALFGRVWCGWACPQTVYMEFVYRPIERLFTGRSGRGGAPKNVAGWRIVAMYGAFLLVSMYLAHTFLAYFVGVDQLKFWVRQSPLDHPAAFVIMLSTTGLMMFDFAFFREQTCIIACPYGRLQSVLMDRQSLLISYDEQRGEPRGKKRSTTSLPVLAERSSLTTDHRPPTTSQGDCIDCEMCVQVCPTGIDIRGGLQIECVGCAQCIDVCDTVMDKIGSPRGLIRYSSQSAMAGEKTKIVRPRVIIYALVITGLLSTLSFLLLTKSPLDMTLLRSLGRPFVITDSGDVENTLRIKLTNRSEKPMRLRFAAVDNPLLKVAATQDVVELSPSAQWTEPLLIVAPPKAFPAGTLTARIRVTTEDGVSVDRECLLLGPAGAASNPGEHR